MTSRDGLMSDQIRLSGDINTKNGGLKPIRRSTVTKPEL